MSDSEAIHAHSQGATYPEKKITNILQMDDVVFWNMTCC